MTKKSKNTPDKQQSARGSNSSILNAAISALPLNSRPLFALTMAFLSVTSLSFANAQSAPPQSLAPQSQLQAQPSQVQSSNPFLVTANDMKRGSLLLNATEAGKMVEAIQLATNVEIDVSGPIARTKVTQRFRNPSQGWVEGTYVFPLPENSAVDTLKMQIGDRFIEGIVKPKEEAKEIYEEAKRSGKKASLVEQLRPNMFTNSVANIGPGEIIVVQIEYQESVKQSDGIFSLRFPMVVAPRYNPKPTIVETVSFNKEGSDNKDKTGNSTAAGNTGWGTIKDPVPDRDKITPPVLDPRKHSKTNPVTLTMNLSAGFPIGEIQSPFHDVITDYQNKERVRVSLADEVVPADRDFEITWRADKSYEPRVALFKENTPKGDFILAFVTPPNLKNVQEDTFQTKPREAIFVVDNSGSMSGPSMRQAKDSLLFALDKLSPQDRFNIVRFDDTFEVLFSSAVDANQENINTAKKFVSSLEAEGGTEMLPALKAALKDAAPHDTDYLRQVIFLTDGAIGNEKEMFDTIVKQRGRSRIFTVGIGSAPNSHFMRRASEFGQGTFTHIGSEQQVKERMKELINKLENPVMTDLTATWTTIRNVESSPTALPDLYSGEPIILTARSEGLSGDLQLSGRYDNQPWMITLPLDQAAKGKGIDKLWARRKISEYEGQYFLSDDWNSLDQSITQTALDYHLVSRLTSLVAVDITPSRPQGEDLASKDIPLNLPEGWDFDKVFGQEYTDDTMPLQDASLDEVNDFISKQPTQLAMNAAGAKSLPLPATATTAELKILTGFALLLFSLLMLLLLRRKDIEGNKAA